jgi:DNA polymerase-3 subunit beta
MKINLSKQTLQTALQNLGKATPTRSTIPILNTVLFTAKGSLNLRTTDLEISIVALVESKIEEEGAVAIPYRTLSETVNAMPDTEIFIEADEDNRVEIRTDFGNYDIAGSSAEEFPATPEVDNKKEIKISSDVFKRLILKTSFALSSDELKPALMGALFEVGEERVASVATDGHRLAICSRTDYETAGYSGDVIVPKKFLHLVLPYLDEQEEVVLWVGDNHLTVSFNGITAFSRIIDERYPDYRSVLPQENDKIVKVDREKMLAAVKRVSIFSNRATRQVTLKFADGKSQITTEDPESASSAAETVDVEYNGEELTIGFNALYLSDILSHLDTESAYLRLNTPISATLISPDAQQEQEEITMLLMPMRTSGQ